MRVANVVGMLHFALSFGDKGMGNKAEDRSNSFYWLLFAQAQVAFSDNAAKMMLIGLASIIEYSAAGSDGFGGTANLLAILLVIPFVVFAPLAGWLSDRFSKKLVINWTLSFQVLVMLGLLGSLLSYNLGAAIVCFGMLAVQSTFFSPAKQGIVKELVGEARLGFAVGVMELVTVASILGGAFAGAVFFKDMVGWTGGQDPWMGGVMTAGVLAGMAMVALLVFQQVPRTEPQSKEVFKPGILIEHFSHVRELWANRALRLSALGVAYFYSFGGIIFLILIQIGQQMYGGDAAAVGESGLLLLLLGSGIVFGSAWAALESRNRIELGMVPAGAIGILVFLGLLAISSADGWFFKVALVGLGTTAGWFVVPLNAYLQNKADDSHRGRVLSATNLLTNIGGVLAALIQYAFAKYLGLGPSGQFGMMAIPSFLVAGYVLWLLPEAFMRFLILLATKTFYRVEVRGLEHFPKKGGALLISNHLSYLDVVVLSVASPRKVRFLGYEELMKRWYMRWVFRVFGVIPVSSKRSLDAIKTAASHVADGKLVCIFPEGEISRTGTLMGFRKGFELIARRANAPVVPVVLDSVWGSIFSFYGNRYIWKRPKQIPYRLQVAFGEPLAPTKFAMGNARQTILDLGEETFQKRDELRGHLGDACFRNLAKQPWKELIIDCTVKRKVFKAGTILVAALALSRVWKKTIAKKRVGLVFPPGAGGAIANLAVVLAGKVPVNLNFSLGAAAFESCLKTADIDTVITSSVFKSKFDKLPWPEDTRDLIEERSRVSGLTLGVYLALIWTLPVGVLARLFSIPREGDREEAALLFSSGSTGNPKGVVLTHRNILGNVNQIQDCAIFPEDEILLACLPIFHSFGFTVTLWFPLIAMVRVVTMPSPLEFKRIAKVIEAEKATVLLGTPTFFRPYLSKVDPEQLKSLHFVVAGAEKTPKGFADRWKERFGCPYLEGYGLTETSPVVSINLPDPPVTTSTAEPQSGSRIGSTGRMFPGIAARIVDPDTGETKSIEETGMLHLRGPNIFPGYLNDPERTADVFADGWFITGDLGRFDSDGFLYIEGRVSRFSKIGGEMVPHGTVEQEIARVYGVDGSDRAMIAVAGIADEAKGEALVLLTAMEIEPAELRKKLTDLGLPNLWIPKKVKQVEAIPCLPTGKLDLKAISSLASE